MAAPILWALAFFGSFCWKTPHAHKIPRFMRRFLFFFFFGKRGGGGGANFIFMGAGIFLNMPIQGILPNLTPGNLFMLARAATSAPLNVLSSICLRHVMAKTCLHTFYVMAPILCFPQFFSLWWPAPHQLHTKFQLSKCNFFAHNGLHENYGMSQKVNFQDWFCCCNVFEGWGMVLQHLTQSCSSGCSI